MRRGMSRRRAVRVVSVALLGGVLSACRTTPPAGPDTVSLDRGVPEGLEVVEREELEPMWADFVKYYYPAWRKHYWVDRGEWGNKGYILGRPPETRRTGEMPRVQLAEQAPYGLSIDEMSTTPRKTSELTAMMPPPVEPMGPAAGEPAGLPTYRGEVPGGEPLGGIGSEPPAGGIAPPPPVVRETPPAVEAAPVPAPAREGVYVVQKGDSLWKIASKVYGDPLGWIDIYRANQDVLKDRDRIFPGQQLVIPPR